MVTAPNEIEDGIFTGPNEIVGGIGGDTTITDGTFIGPIGPITSKQGNMICGNVNVVDGTLICGKIGGEKSGISGIGTANGSTTVVVGSSGFSRSDGVTMIWHKSLDTTTTGSTV
jgi:hypothetical protein